MIHIFNIVVMNVKFVLYFDFSVVFECGQLIKNFIAQEITISIHMTINARIKMN